MNIDSYGFRLEKLLNRANKIRKPNQGNCRNENKILRTIEEINLN